LERKQKLKRIIAKANVRIITGKGAIKRLSKGESFITGNKKTIENARKNKNIAILEVKENE